MEEIQPNSELNSSSDYFLNPNSDKISNHYDSIFSNKISNGGFLIRELIGNLGNSSPPPPPKINFPVRESMPSIETSMPAPLNSTSVEEFSADPGFEERAARFSRFGSRNLNCRTTTGFGSNCSELSLPYGSYPLMASNGKLARVSSTPSLQALGSNNNNFPEESTLSEQIPAGGETTSLKSSNDLNSRKRKGVPKGKVKELVPSSPSVNITKVGEIDHNSSAKKRYRVSEGNGRDQNQKGISCMKAEENTGPAAEDEKDKETKSSPKPLEAPKDYIHVRARRGQATDSHSLAERVRREKISERMKVLQDTVPGCNKVTGKALLLDEIINYVQSLQRQVEFLSMKLASVNTNLDCNGDDALLISKELYQSSSPSLPCLDSTLGNSFYSHQSRPNPLLQNGILNGQMENCSAFNPLNTATVHENHYRMQLIPQINGFITTASASQYTKFGEDDLQSIVQMGVGQQQHSNYTASFGSNLKACILKT